MLTTICPEDTGKNKQGNDFKDFCFFSPLSFLGICFLVNGKFYPAESGILIKSGEGLSCLPIFLKGISLSCSSCT